MLVGMNQNNELINLGNHTKEEIKGLKQERHYCPCCKEQVIIKNGAVMMSHFAHLSTSLCACFSENESEEHLRGKQVIAQNCETFCLPYQVEAYLPKLKQRPDVLIAQNIAIEFQCSSLSIERMIERTHSYQQAGYTVIWLLGKKLQLKERLSTLQKSFVNLSNEIGFYMWGLDVDKRIIRNWFFIRKEGNRVIYSEKSWDLRETSLLESFEFPKSAKRSYQYKTSTWRNIQLKNKKWNQELNQQAVSTMTLQAHFYERQLNVRELPLPLMVPTIEHPLLEDSEYMIRSFVWQFFEAKEKGKIEDILADVHEKMNQTIPTYICLITVDKLLRYSVSFFLCALKQQGLIAIKEGMYVKTKSEYLVKGKVKENLRNKQEILSIPLKYVMISK